jgi:tetratricopeptide (TPR) repeat protein
MLDIQTPIVLEQHQRLSQSQLFQIERMFYQQQGIRAWNQGDVPHYATSNPFIASAYGKVVFGFLRDWYAVAAGSPSFRGKAEHWNDRSDKVQELLAKVLCHISPRRTKTLAAFSLDLSQPVYIIELGAGSGLFSYYFLKKFLDFFARSVLKELPIKYVMTDFSEQNIAFWQQHDSLQPFVEQGFLDFAFFDVEHPQELLLRHAGTVLSESTIKNPLVLLANYLFDSLPQDCFLLQSGQLHESLVTLSTSEPNPDLTNSALLSSLQVSYEHHPIGVEYYDDPACNQILQSYQQRLPDTMFLFPNVVLRCLSFFRNLSSNRLLLLSADKGTSREADLVSEADPSIALHGGCFSMMVNYHAIGEYVRNLGGQVLHVPHRHTWLNVCAYLLGQHPTNYLETAQAFHEAIEQWGPDEFLTLKLGIEEMCHTLSLEQLLAYLQLCGWDSRSFLGCFPLLLEKVETCSLVQRQELYQVAQQVWNASYSINEKQDLAYALAVLLYNLKYYAQALDYFQISLQRYGPHENTLSNMAKCHAALQLETR